MNLLSSLPAADVVAAHPVVVNEVRQLRALESLKRLPRRELDQVVLRDCGVDLRSLDHESALKKAAELSTSSMRCTDTQASDVTAIPQPITTVPMSEPDDAYLRSHGGWKNDTRERVVRPEPDDADYIHIGARMCPRWAREW